MNRQPRQHCDAHLAFIRLLPCCVCGDDTTTEAAHVRYPSSRAAKRSVGMGEKPDDSFTVPLCGECHRKQHGINEREFWKQSGVDPIFTALALWNATGNTERGEQIVRVMLGR